MEFRQCWSIDAGLDGWYSTFWARPHPLNVAAMEVHQTRPHFSDLFLTWFGESGLNVAWDCCCSLSSGGRGGGDHLVWSICRCGSLRRNVLLWTVSWKCWTFLHKQWKRLLVKMPADPVSVCINKPLLQMITTVSARTRPGAAPWLADRRHQAAVEHLYETGGEKTDVFFLISFKVINTEGCGWAVCFVFCFFFLKKSYLFKL